MTDKILYVVSVDSCENCPGGVREQYGLYRCKHDTDVVFRQNHDMGVPKQCPMRVNK